MSEAMEKGDALHRAVGAIEHTILSQSPALGEKTFVIEHKKVVRVNGVRHEVDIYVTVDPAPGYASIYIFECKNWEKPVGKNEITNFTEKSKVLNASHGYFVAKSFTKDARAQAALDGRMTLLLAEHEFEGLVSPVNIHGTATEAKHVNSDFKARDSKGGPSQKIDLNTATFVVCGQSTGVSEFLVDWAQKAMGQHAHGLRTNVMPEGAYEQMTSAVREFSESELLVNGIDIARVEITVTYLIHVYHPPIISRFDIEARGRHWLFAPFILPQGGSLQMGITEGPDFL